MVCAPLYSCAASWWVQQRIYSADREREKRKEYKTSEEIGTLCDVTCAADHIGEAERRKRREKRKEEHNVMGTPMYMVFLQARE